MPKVSVIIPTYNRNSLVKKAVDSVLSQTFEDLEVIVIDDGSNDNTRSVIDSINDKRVKYFYKENGGVSSARNLGIAKAEGQYIAFLDSDDAWPEKFLEILIAKLDQNPQYGLAYTSVTLVSAEGAKLKSPDASHCKSGKITADLFKKGFVWISTAVLRKEVLKGFRFDESLRSAEDSDALLRLSARTQFLYVPDIRVCRRTGPDSLSCSLGINCNRILSLERFYFHLGGKQIISPQIAKVKLSHACRRIAEEHRKAGNKSAAKYLYKKAIRYYPLDFRLYAGFLQTILMSEVHDKIPDWKMPPPLPGTINLES